MTVMCSFPVDMVSCVVRVIHRERPPRGALTAPGGSFSVKLDNLSTSETESIAPRAETLGRVVVLFRFNPKGD